MTARSNRDKMNDCIAEVEDAQNRIAELFSEALGEVLAEHEDMSQVNKAIRKRGLPALVANERAEAKMSAWPDLQKQVDRREKNRRLAVMYGIAAGLDER